MRLVARLLAIGTLASGVAAAQTESEICTDDGITAREVSTESDVKLFVECAKAFYDEVGPDEARHAFNQDPRWKHGPTYVFVIEQSGSGVTARRFIFPRNPAVEGLPRGAALVDFGTDLYAEISRVMDVVDEGWFYYSTLNPQTGNREFKVSYMIEVDYEGTPAVIGAGLYRRDLPATCHAEDVNALSVAASMDDGGLQEFVRCAAQLVEQRGYFAKHDFAEDARWSGAGTSVFVLDLMGNQVLASNRFRINGRAPHEWGSQGGSAQFGGRLMVDVGDTFGEAFIYYRAYHPETWEYLPKVGFLKRVVSEGIPLLVGAGYFPAADQAAPSTTCAEHSVSTENLRSSADLEAFVRCAAEYVAEHGEEEARRAFHEDRRWVHGPTYVFVDAAGQAEGESTSYVFPPDPSLEGAAWGVFVDEFETDYFVELNRILSMRTEGWMYYSFTNPVSGLSEPKSSYVMEIEWNGKRAAIGAGIYSRDIPGTCNPGEVNAAMLEASQTEANLRAFVNCAAYEAQSSGFFAGPVLSSDPRWNHGSIYVFGVNADTGEVVFSGNRASFAVSGRTPEALFGGRDLIEATAAFGAGTWYYNFNNPASGTDEPKLSYAKLVWAQGVRLVVGAGINAEH